MTTYTSISMVRFSTTLKRTAPKTTGIVVPDAVLAKLSSSRRPALTVTVNGYRYRTTVGIMGGVAMLPFNAEHRKASGLNAGDAIEVELRRKSGSRRGNWRNQNGAPNAYLLAEVNRLTLRPSSSKIRKPEKSSV